MKKILKNKNIMLILLIIDLLFLIFLFMKCILFGIIYLICNFIIILLIFKLHFNISILNINKIKNIFKTKKIRKNIDIDEKYLAKMKIDTFDGSGGTTHPYVIKFDKLYFNYKYYMVHTPYDNHNVSLENPSLCVSNNNIDFIKKEGVNDPLLSIINNKGKILQYYSDNFIFYENNELQVWYRYTEEDKSIKPYKLKNQIYRIITKDGINFSKPELMIDEDGIWYLSPSIIKINNLYYLYYFDKDYKFYVKNSKDLKNWSSPNEVKIDNYNGKYWHGEVKVYNNEIYTLFLSKDYNLYFCKSDINTPYNFKECSKLNFNYYDKCNIYGNAHPYKSSFIFDDEYIIFYVPFVVNKINWFKIKGIKHTKWTMTYTKLKKDNFNKHVKE